jgi:hypothetical protein
MKRNKARPQNCTTIKFSMKSKRVDKASGLSRLKTEKQLQCEEHLTSDAGAGSGDQVYQ